MRYVGSERAVEVPSRHHESGISAVVLSWQRPDNVVRIVETLTSSPLVNEVLVWNNNATVDLSHLASDRVVILGSSRNFKAFSRYCVVPLTSSETILFQDDDVLFRPVAIERLYEECTQDSSRIYGHRGRNLSPDGQYLRGEVLGECDIILGQLMLFSRELLSRVFGSFLRLTPFDRGDDIAFSLLSKGRHRAIEIPYVDLGSRDGFALFEQPGHFELRQDMVDRILNTLGQMQPSDRHRRNICPPPVGDGEV